MEAMLLTRLAPKGLFLVDWSASPTATSFVDKSGQVTLTRQAVQAAITTDALLGNCIASNGYGGWLQTNTDNPLDFRVAKWTLSIDTIAVSAGANQTLMAQARSASGAGGWYLALTAGAGRFDFYYKDGANTWRVLSSSGAIPLNVKLNVKIVRDGTSLKLYLNDVLNATVSSNVSFNYGTYPVAIGQWSDGKSNVWYGKIGTISFTAQ